MLLLVLTARNPGMPKRQNKYNCPFGPSCPNSKLALLLGLSHPRYLVLPCHHQLSNTKTHAWVFYCLQSDLQPLPQRWKYMNNNQTKGFVLSSGQRPENSFVFHPTRLPKRVLLVSAQVSVSYLEGCWIKTVRQFSTSTHTRFICTDAQALGWNGPRDAIRQS